MSDNKQPPADLLAKCEEINQQRLVSAKAYCEPYLDEGEWGDNWKIRIRDQATNLIISQHHFPDNVGNGHSLYLAVMDMRHAWECGVERGLALAAQRQIDAIVDTIGVPAHHQPLELSGYESDKRAYRNK